MMDSHRIFFWWLVTLIAFEWLWKKRLHMLVIAAVAIYAFAWGL